MFDRITSAFIGAIFGALIGVGCWWLYGLAHSRNYDGPGIDPVLRHWVTYAGGAFGVIGFLLRQRLGDAVGDTIGAIVQFEANESPRGRASPFLVLVFLSIIVAAIWFSVPS